MIMKSNRNGLQYLIKKGIIIISIIALINIICISIGILNKYIILITGEAFPITMIIFLVQHIKNSKSEHHDLGEIRYSWVMPYHMGDPQIAAKMMIILLSIMALVHPLVILGME